MDSWNSKRNLGTLRIRRCACQWLSTSEVFLCVCVCVCACVCCWDGLIRGIYFRWSTDVLKLFNLLRSKYYLYNDDDVNCPAPFL
mmetsp:Transcript_497/g.960  ORF Transcript_497/g.960 Transcript_497/m.960 type:complete len:85 (-) Transcript_497:2033-2287(-)